LEWRLERLIAVFVVCRAAIDWHRDQRGKERCIHNRPHERHEVEPLYRQRAWPPDQREGKQPEAHIAQDLPNDVETRVWCPGGISRVRSVEIGDNGQDAPANSHQ
jgi:hypothetical protein